MKRKRVKSASCVTVGVFLLLLLTATMASPAWQPPKHIPAGSFQVESMGYISATALHSGIQEATGVRIPTTPGATSIERASLLKRGDVTLSWLISPDVWHLAEGISDFKSWGPQSIRIVWHGGQEYVGILARLSSGIKTVQDLRGKRVTDYPNYPLMQAEMAGALAYGNLEWKDVIRIPVGGFADGIRAVIAGAADAAFASNLVGLAYDLESSVHGIYWIPYPNETPADNAAWARLHKHLAAYFPGRATVGAGIKPDKPVDIWTGNYHVVAYDWADENLVHWYAQQVHKNYDRFKDKHPFLKQWTLEHSLGHKLWFCPLHPGTVRYYKEIGVWTPEMQKKQDENLKKYPQTMTK